MNGGANDGSQIFVDVHKDFCRKFPSWFADRFRSIWNMLLRTSGEDDPFLEARKPFLVREGWEDITQPQDFTDPQQIVRISRILVVGEEVLLILSRLSTEEQASFFDAPLQSLPREYGTMRKLHDEAVQVLELHGEHLDGIACTRVFAHRRDIINMSCCVKFGLQ